MKKIYKNRLPKNMEASSINAKVVDGEIIVEVEMKEIFQPKDGDFCVDADGDVFIACTERSDISFIGAYVGENKDLPCPFYFNGVTYIKDCRYATPKEKADFLKRLEKKCHKRWNPETKEPEDIRWKPKARECYFYADYDGKVKKAVNLTVYDAFRISINNCFKTEEAAKPYAEQIKEIFKNSKAE